MIGVVDVEIQAANPQMPLYPMRAFVNSPSSIRVRNVPRKIGSWQITAVQLVAAYPDNSIKTADCKIIGCVWVGTIAGSSVSGTSENGYTIFANGIDENGNAVTGYVLGKGDIEILEADGTITPGEDTHYVHMLDDVPTSPKEGDLWNDDGTWYIYQDGTSYPIGDDSGLIQQLSDRVDGVESDIEDLQSGKQDKLSDPQISAIDSVVNERRTAVKFDNNEIRYYDVAGELTQAIRQGWETDVSSTVKEVKIGNTVTSIGESAFEDCSRLTSVTIPDSVTSIGEYAFCWSGLTSVTIPNSVTRIWPYAFVGCSGLTSVTIPDSMEIVEEDAFANCINLANITVVGKTQAQAEELLTNTGVSPSIITTWNDASQEWVKDQNYLSSVPSTYKTYQETVSSLSNDGYATTTYAVKNDGGVAKIKSLTQADYDALASVDLSTLYVIPEEA